ncbi:hypothetical protein UB31_10805 [Bradyrhizobium sp. LTSP849]|nr:hypothetical protein UB31_10805 [Bradyrhizobium sp. LTSP849]
MDGSARHFVALARAARGVSSRSAGTRPSERSRIGSRKSGTDTARWRSPARQMARSSAVG